MVHRTFDKARLCIAWAAIAGMPSMSGAVSPPEKSADAVRGALAKQNPQLPIQKVQSSPARELFEVSMAGSTGYATPDGRYFVIGDLYEVATRKNLSEEQRKVRRAELLKDVDWSQSIVFSPDNPRYTVVVFTDVDCAYCRKLHSEIGKLLELGIRVRYLAYPRSGPASESWATMEAVWCAADRNDALTRAKRGEKVERAMDCVAPQIAQDYALGESLSVHGTPLILQEDGSVVGGYLPPAQLVHALDQLARQKAVARNAE